MQIETLFTHKTLLNNCYLFSLLAFTAHNVGSMFERNEAAQFACKFFYYLFNYFGLAAICCDVCILTLADSLYSTCQLKLNYLFESLS